ncbi:hypothetical protein GCM10023069_60120 [Shinella granuli]
MLSRAPAPTQTEATMTGPSSSSEMPALQAPQVSAKATDGNSKRTASARI